MSVGHDLDRDNLLLSYCYCGRMPIAFLRRDDVDEVLNMPHHGMAKVRLAQRLQRLVGKQWLEASAPGSDPLPAAEGVKALTPMLDLPEQQAREICLSLTADGGEIWERFAKPRWWAFVSDEIANVIDGRVHLIYRSHSRRMIAVLGDMIDYSTHLRHERHVVREIGPWRPELIRWKTFRRGSELKIDTGISPDSREGQCYQGNCLSDVSDGLANVVLPILSVWRQPFRIALDELRSRLGESGVL
jgi:hypothetical protein